MDILKSLSFTELFYSDVFAQVFLQKCFIFTGFHGKDCDKSKFWTTKIMKLNWVRISRTYREKKPPLDSSTMRINNKEMNELRRMTNFYDFLFETLMFPFFQI